MTVWELRTGGTNDFSPLIFGNDQDIPIAMLYTNGELKQWPKPPQIHPYVEPRKKKQKPLADLGYIGASNIILGPKAHAALKDFLLQFGQLLEMDCLGETHYFYNVTNQIDCIDYAHSEKINVSVMKEVFLRNAVPPTPQIFVDKYTANRTIYVNPTAKAILEKLIADAKLTGVRFIEAGKGFY